ncbi:DUF6221 family protein [Streptomyces sp. NPDC018019]|uniref:DUF6221 family protein n=1 Tax=Streptomyces sp. NPDC018019 TaxID=3365030 RepID=UPI00379BC66C
MNADLVEFIRARLDDDEQVARAASDGPWAAWVGPPLQRLGALMHPVRTAGEGPSLQPTIETALWMDSRHIAEWDPARVLAEVEAKRGVLDRYERALENRRAHPGDLASAGAVLALHGVVKTLTLPYAGHPDYQERWRL